METCLAETGMNIYLIAAVAMFAIIGGGAMLYKPLRKKLGLFAFVFSAACTFSYATPAFAAAADDCTDKVSQTPGATPAPANPEPETPECVPSDTVTCGDSRVRSDGQGRIVACNADSNEVGSWTNRIYHWDTAQSENVDIDPDTPGVQHTLDKPDQGFRAVYDPDSENLTVTITDASLYPAPPATCGPCDESQAPLLLVASWIDRNNSFGNYNVMSDGCGSYGGGIT